MIDIATKKILDIEIIEQGKQYVIGNTIENSNNLESVGIRRLAKKWENDKRIVGYVHDNNGTTRKIFKEEKWNINESSFKKSPKFCKKKNQEFSLIENSLEKWLISILKSDDDPNTKKDLWLNSFHHYNNNHDKCRHKN